MEYKDFKKEFDGMILKEKKRTFKKNGITFSYKSLYYYDLEDKHHYTTTELDTENLKRLKRAERETLIKYTEKYKTKK